MYHVSTQGIDERMMNVHLLLLSLSVYQQNYAKFDGC